MARYAALHCTIRKTAISYKMPHAFIALTSLPIIKSDTGKTEIEKGQRFRVVGVSGGKFNYSSDLAVIEIELIGGPMCGSVVWCNARFNEFTDIYET